LFAFHRGRVPVVLAEDQVVLELGALAARMRLVQRLSGAGVDALAMVAPAVAGLAECPGGSFLAGRSCVHIY